MDKYFKYFVFVTSVHMIYLFLGIFCNIEFLDNIWFRFLYTVHMPTDQFLNQKRK